MISFRPAVRENVNALLSFAGGTGSGKTLTAMRVARGLAGDKPFYVIDTENRRALHYVDLVPPGGEKVRFEYGEITDPFSPAKYIEAIDAAEKAGARVIIIDSASHEHAGEGGLLDMHEAALQKMAGNDWQRREACKMAAWVEPKGEHKKLVNRMLRCRAHLILCLRAETKIEMVKDGNGKTQIRPKTTLTGLDGWVPICEKNLPFEMTCSFLLTPDKPGFPKPIKLQEQHKAFFPLDRPVTEESGRLLAAWAQGSTAAPPLAEESVSTLLSEDLIQRIADAGDLAELELVMRDAKRNKSKMTEADQGAVRDAHSKRNDELAGEQAAAS